MTTRKVSLVIWGGVVLALLSGFPTPASEPEGLVGEMIAHFSAPGPGYCSPNTFFWDHPPQVGPRPLDSSDTVTLDFAIVPFASGQTLVSFTMGGGPFLQTTVIGLPFQDGVITLNDGSELPYDRNGWNNVLVFLNHFRREFEVTVNGHRAGPYPYPPGCSFEGACSSLEQFQIYGFDVPGGGTGWVDSVEIVRHATDHDDLYHFFNADPCSDLPPVVVGGGVIFVEPPKKLHSKASSIRSISVEGAARGEAGRGRSPGTR